MRISFDSAECVRVSVFGFENDFGYDAVHKAALTWDAEFGGEVISYMGDDGKGMGHDIPPFV